MLERPPRTRVALVAVGLVTGIVGAWAWTADPVALRDPTDPCVDAAAEMREVYPPEVRVRLAERFVSPEIAYSLASWQRIQRRLDANADAWRAMARDTCEATRVRGEQSDGTHALRTECLDARLDEMRAILDVLETTQPERVADALVAVAGLPSVSRCDAGPQLAQSTVARGADAGAARALR